MDLIKVQGYQSSLKTFTCSVLRMTEKSCTESATSLSPAFSAYIGAEPKSYKVQSRRSAGFGKVQLTWLPNLATCSREQAVEPAITSERCWTWKADDKWTLNLHLHITVRQSIKQPATALYSEDSTALGHRGFEGSTIFFFCIRDHECAFQNVFCRFLSFG